MSDDRPLRVVHEAAAAVVLVDRASGTVVHANRHAAALAGKPGLPCPVGAWAAAAGLQPRRTGRGSEDAGVPEPLARAARGEPVSGELVAARDGALWLTGFPLDAGPLAGHALVVLLELAATAGPRDDAAYAAAPVDVRAVVTTELSFTITDPHRPDNPLIWVNPAFTRLTGYPASEVVGRNCRFLQGPDSDQAEARKLREAIEAAAPTTVTLLNHRRDGSAFWNQVSVSPVFDSAGDLLTFVGVQVDVTERVQAEQARRLASARVDLLARVGTAVTELDGPLALERLAEVLVPVMGAGCLVATVDRELTVVATSGAVDGAARGRHRRVHAPGRTGDDALRDLLAGADREPVELDVARARQEGGLTAWLARLLVPAQRALAFPVSGRDAVLGLVVLTDGPRDADDLAVLREAIARCGLAVDNARLYARQHALAETLQRSLLPGPTALPDLDVWAHYAPNVDLAQVGGDWYDVITRPDGTHAVVIGDVVGHDVEAAAVMGQLRSICRAYAYEIADPAQVLDRVDQLAFSMHLPRLASAVLVTLRREGEGWRATWANAGHLPPLLRRAGAVTALESGTGSLIGLLAGDRGSETALLQPDDELLLYTDGLVERRGRPMRQGLVELTEIVAAAPPRPGAESLGRAVLAGAGADAEDDIALLAIRVPAPDSGPAHVPSARSRVLERSEHAPRQARALAAEWLRALGRPVADAPLLVVSELVTNAVRHGSGPVTLSLSVDGGRLRVQVDDAGRSGPEVVDPRREGGGQGLHIVDELADWGWAPTQDGKSVWAVLREASGRPG